MWHSRSKLVIYFQEANAEHQAVATCDRHLQDRGCRDSIATFCYAAIVSANMTRTEVQTLRHGVYRLHWTEAAGGGSSLAVVGSMYSGARWFACANRTGKDGKGIPGSDNDESWSEVERAELIEAA